MAQATGGREGEKIGAKREPIRGVRAGARNGNG